MRRYLHESTKNIVSPPGQNGLAVGEHLIHEWSWKRSFSMYVMFHQTVAQSRRNGARGGRTFARNLRLRKLSTPPPPILLPPPPQETAHEASLLLDRQFPWLAGAFAPRKRRLEVVPK